MTLSTSPIAPEMVPLPRAPDAIDAFERGGSFLLLSLHAETIEAAKARLLAISLLQAGTAPASPRAADASDHALH
jgi:hypothetical protein